MLLAPGWPSVKPDEGDYQAVEDVRLGHQALFETEMRHQAWPVPRCPPTMTGALAGSIPGRRARRSPAAGSQVGQRPLHRLPRQPVVVHRVVVVGLEPLVVSRPGRKPSRPGQRARGPSAARAPRSRRPCTARATTSPRRQFFAVGGSLWKNRSVTRTQPRSSERAPDGSGPTTSSVEPPPMSATSQGPSSAL